MRKVKIFSALLAVLTLLFLVACGGENETPDGGAGNADNNAPVHTHAFGEWETTKLATCTEAGTRVRKCSCGESESETLAALGHDEVSHEAKEPTCTEIGFDAYVTCTRCDYTTYKEKAALGHDEVSISSKAPTCTDSGFTEGKKCSRCNITLVAPNPTEALGHNFENNVCTRCGLESVTELGCKELATVWITEYFDSYEKFSKYLSENNYSGNAELECYNEEYFKQYNLLIVAGEDGSPDLLHMVTREIVGASYNIHINSYSKARVVQGGPAGIHPYVEYCYVAIDIPKDSVVGMDILRAYHDKILVKEFDISKDCKHTQTYISELSPTCTENGAENRVCADCGLIVESTPIPAKGHSFGEWKTVLANGCADKDYSLRICLVCFFVEHDGGDISHPHDFEMLLDDATCTASGRIKLVCKNCGIVGADEILSPKGHNLNWVFTKDTHSKKCVREGCGYVTAAEAHITEETSPCVDARCVICQYIVKAGIGHSFSDTYSSNENFHWHECERIGCDYIDSLGKHYNPDAICTQSSAICVICSKIFTPSGAHSMSDWHQIKAPTCTESGILRSDCEYCDHYVTEPIKPLGHVMGNWYTVIPPTETDKGLMRRDCGRCDYYETNDIEATGHNFGDWYVTITPTCIKAGEMRRDCQDCDYVQIIKISPLGHTCRAWYTINSPTCTDNGSSYGYCSRCGAYVTRVDDALGHKFGDFRSNDSYHWKECVRCAFKVENAPHSGGNVTCTQRARCKTCFAYYGEAPLGHSFSTEYSYDRYYHYYICINGCGETLGKESHNLILKSESVVPHDDGAQIKYIHTLIAECSVCGGEITVQTVLNSEHYGCIILDAVEPTCTKTGLTIGYKCAVHGCNDVYVEQQVIPALGHNYVGGVCTRCGKDNTTPDVPANPGDPNVSIHVCTDVKWVTTQEASCTKEGKRELVCSCGRVLSSEAIPKTPHNTLTSPAKAPTCTEIGWDAYVTCTRCDYTTYEEKSALGHDEVSHKAKAPTCTEKGWDAYVTCTRCDYTTYEEKSALGHDEVSHKAKAPTCTEIGWDAYATCTRCDYTTYEEKSALGHDEVSHKAKAPTCTEKGWDAYVTCTRCDYTTYEEKSALGHDEVSHKAKAPNCTEIGWDAYVTCTRCDYTTYEEKSALGHDEVSHKAKAPTCTEAGWDAYVTCTRCDYTTYEEKSALGHDEVSHKAKAPNCTEIGWDAYVTCTRCDYTTYEEKVALGHDEVSHKAKAPTCTEIGWDAYVTCTRCDYTTYAEKAALGHSPKTAVEENRVEATCTENGSYDSVVYCNTCGDELSRTNKTIPKLGHSPKTAVEENRVEATCTENGSYDSVVYCNTCGDELSRTKKTITKLGHSPKTAVEENRVEATCTEDGSYDSVVYCNTCGEELSRTKKTITKLGHTEATRQENRVEATCTEDGSYDSVVYCKTCGEELSRTEKEILRSHKMSGGKCTVCGLPESSTGLKFSLNPDGKSYTVTGIGSGTSTDIVIGVYNGLSVTTIGVEAFRNCTSLTSVTIGNSVTTIGDWAFLYCSSLTSVVIPDSVTTIGYRAFLYCSSLTSITIPFVGATRNGSNNTHFGYIFGASSYSYNDNYIPATLKKVIITGGNSIDEYAFAYCSSLTSVTIGNSVTTIGDSAFYKCTSLTSVYITDIAAWCGIEFEDYDSNPLCYGGNLYLNGTLVKDLVIPDSVTTIGNYAFDNCYSLTSVTIGNSVTTIGDYAFSGCDSLTSVTIGNGVTTIGDYAFDYCYNLTSVVIGNSVTTIGDGAFCWCTSLTSVVIGNSVTTIGDSAFYYCPSLTSVTIPDSVTTIGDRAFYSCDSLTSVTIGNSVTTIGSSAFYYCSSLTSVYITDIAAWCGIEFEDYDSHPLCYGGNLYLNGTLVKDLVIPDSVTTIGNYAFSYCYSLTSVVIPDSVTSIGDYAFSDCTSLTSVYITDIAAWCGIEFEDYDSNPLYYAENLYLNGTLVKDLVIPDGVTNIPSYAFSCENLTSVVIPDSVTSIGDWAFYRCYSLTSITVDENNTAYKSIDGNLYAGDGKTLIQYAIGKTETSFTIPSSVTTIGDRAFYRCYSLTSVVIPDSVTTIGNYAFYNCDSLTSVVIPDSVTTIGAYAFYDCDSLTSVTIGNSVTTIGNYAFDDCTSLTSVTIGNSVTTIGDYAFFGCDSLTSIKYRGTRAQWNAISEGYYWNYDTGNYTITYNYDGD